MPIRNNYKSDLDSFEYLLDSDTENAWDTERYPSPMMFDFTTFTFGPVGYQERYGPPYAATVSNYQNISPGDPWVPSPSYWIDTNLTNSEGYQELRIPASGPWTVTLAGSPAHGPLAGRGIIISNTFDAPLTAYSFVMVTGQHDGDPYSSSTGGGGGTFFAIRPTNTSPLSSCILIAAAGGGGGQYNPGTTTGTTMDAHTSTSGRAGGCSSGGTNGSGGSGCTSSGASGGGGYSGNGTSGTYGTYGEAFVNGAAGGNTSNNHYGGFGGGGGTHGNTAGGGGGGGYSGGGAGHHNSRGGGGGSYWNPSYGPGTISSPGMNPLTQTGYITLTFN